jgi:hypothetical protein
MEWVAGCSWNRWPDYRGVRTLFLLNQPLLRHTANFRIKIVDDFLSRIAIPNASRRAGQHEIAKAYASNVFVAVGGEYEKLWAGVDELVALRNEIAHGNFTSSVSTGQMIAYCDLLETFCRTLTRVVRDELARLLLDRNGIELGSPIAIYNNSIVCVRTRGIAIIGGQLLACASAQGFSHSCGSAPNNDPFRLPTWTPPPGAFSTLYQRFTVFQPGSRFGADQGSFGCRSTLRQVGGVGRRRRKRA